ncbi:CpaE family protein [Actinotalea sp. M2MS4P-6]|uniref:AAA family ATPase n=1 Tax=Actinotalea sp. M2MS4P-6 TaxID=2983762 RepID=UPI0021E4C15F|nr:hypothetical protein [Actinotalea sp. M2MS4P-6]
MVRALAGEPTLEVSRRCADLAELLASAAAGLGDVAVVSADLAGLDRESVRHLHGSQCWVVGLADPEAGWSVERTERLGVDAVAPVGEPSEALAAVRGVLARGTRPGQPADRPAEPEPAVAEPAPRTGRLVAVWGPTGAPGRTTVALGLAEALAEHDCLLVDADTYGGTVAPMLGLLDEAPGVAAACRAAATGRLDPAALAALTPQLAPGLRVLTGISRPERWTELPPAHLEEVWAAARGLATWTVVDCGFGLERDEALSYDTRAPQRNGATLSALAAADVVVAVGAADPIGMQRLVRGLMDLDDLELPGSRVVAVGRVRASVAGSRPAGAIRHALARYAGVADAHLLAWDPAACDAAVLAGRLLGEVGAGPLHRDLVALAGAVRSAVGARAAH